MKEFQYLRGSGDRPHAKSTFAQRGRSLGTATLLVGVAGCWPLVDTCARVETVRLDAVGDLDGDGVADLAFSTAEICGRDGAGASSELVFLSGRSGKVIEKIFDESNILWGSLGSKRLDDVDGDGREDVAVASTNFDGMFRIDVLRGSDLEPLWGRTLGEGPFEPDEYRAFMGVGSVGERATLFAAGIWGPSLPPDFEPPDRRLIALDASTGEEVGSLSYEVLGGDLSYDSDLVALECDAGTKVWLPSARAVGASHPGLDVTFFSDVDPRFGVRPPSACGVDDLNGDGCQDLLLCGTGYVGSDGVCVDVVSGSGRETLFSLQGEARELGFATPGSGAMKMGDTPTVAILLSDHNIPGGGKVVFHSLLDGRPLRQLEMSTPAFSFARCGTDLADFSGDGIDEYVVYYWAKETRRHTLACYSGDTVLWEFRL